MFETVLYSIRAAWPIPAGLVLIFIALFVRFSKDGVTVNLWIFKFTISSAAAIRTILVIASVFFFALPALRDYSKIFPTELEARMQYDAAGLRAALDELPEHTKSELKVRTDGWEQEREEILASWGEEVDRHIRVGFSDSDQVNVSPFRFDEHTESVGEVTFRVENVGFQDYAMIKGEGFLDHTYETPMGRLIEARSYFRLATSQKQIEIGLSEIYYHWHMVIEPVFKQYWKSADNVSGVYEAPIMDLCVSATNLIFFPSMRLGKTIFFVEAADGSQELIPVVYGQHIPKKSPE